MSVCIVPALSVVSQVHTDLNRFALPFPYLPPERNNRAAGGAAGSAAAAAAGAIGFAGGPPGSRAGGWGRMPLRSACASSHLALVCCCACRRLWHCRCATPGFLPSRSPEELISPVCRIAAMLPSICTSSQHMTFPPACYLSAAGRALVGCLRPPGVSQQREGGGRLPQHPAHHRWVGGGY